MSGTISRRVAGSWFIWFLRSFACVGFDERERQKRKIGVASCNHTFDENGKAEVATGKQRNLVVARGVPGVFVHPGTKGVGSLL